MKTVILATTLVMTLAAPVFASNTLSQGLDVAPGAYTNAQLIQLREAVQNGDQQRIAFIEHGHANTATTTTVDDLAASLGVSPADYSLSQLIELRNAAENGNRAEVSYLRNEIHEPVSAQSSAHARDVAFQLLGRHHKS
ncbi:hypothetical protein [Nioella nitratireducens]|uniref:hypothetical protein n=1 Tax=Nioella nitratireducens TaxID=1287720 RepID=UPI0008FD940B|nr:hypothetical protein [Nioella nitratireducens]